MTAHEQRRVAAPHKRLGHRMARAYGILVVLVVALVALQIVGGDRLQEQRVVRDARISQLREANHTVLQQLTDAESGVRGFQLTGDTAFLEPYESGRAGAYDSFRGLDTAVTGAGLRRLLAVQRDAAVDWLYAYAVPIVNAGVADADAPRLAAGKRMFDLIRTANADLDAALDTRQRAVAATDRRDVQLARLLFTTLGALILLAGLGVAVLHRRNRRAADQARAAGTDGLRTLDEQKDVFVSTVTHELRTPLTSILGYTEELVAGEPGDLTPPQRRALDAILRNAHRLEATVADLLLLDRTNQGDEAEAVPVDLAALVSALHRDLDAAARAKDLRTELATAPAWVSGDGTRLTRAMRNLMENAIKFTPAGGRLECRLTADDRFVVLSVTDTGIGIPAADVPGLFTPFHRAANAMDQAVQGNGLGLAIVRDIVTEHGGTVAAASELGRGSTFTMTLPALPAHR